MKHKGGVCHKLKFLLCFIIIFLFSISSYGAGEKSWNITYPGSNSTSLPVYAIMNIKSGVLIGPIVAKAAVSGDVTFTNQTTGSTRNLNVGLVDGEYSGDVNLQDVGNYKVEENYVLNVKLYFGVVLIGQGDFPESHVWYYNNQSAGIKTFNVNSSLRYLSSQVTGDVEVYSVSPENIYPGGSASNIMIRALQDINQGELIANDVTLNTRWSKNAGVTAQNAAPVVTITAASQSYSNSDVQITFNLQDTENTVVELQYRGEGITTWTPATIISSTASPGSNTLYWKAAQDQPNGQGAYNIRMRASDGISYSNWDSANVNINNTTAADNNPPSALNLRIATIDSDNNNVVNRQPITGDRLKAVYDFFDPDVGDTESGSLLKWYKNGVLQKSLSISGSDDTRTILTEPIKKGEAWYFTITPSDGESNGPVAQSSPIPIGNAPPSVSNVRIEPYDFGNRPTTQDDLVASYSFFDPEDDEEGTHEIRWYKNGFHQAVHNNVNPLPHSATQRNDEWKFTIRPWDIDGGHPDNFTESPTVTIVNQRPDVEILSVEGNKDANGSFNGDITIRYNLIDDDGDPCRLTVWYQGGPAGVVETSAYIVGATGEANNVLEGVIPATGLTLTWKTKEDLPSGYATDFRIGIRPFDGVDNGSKKLSEVFALDNNNAPSVSNLAISPENPYSIHELNAVYDFQDQEDDQELGTEIKWYKNGEEVISYKNQEQIPNTATQRGEEWYFTVMPKDGKEFGQQLQSPVVTIVNAVPVAKDVTLSPADPTSEDDLVASYVYEDADGDIQQGFKIRWYSNEVLQSQYDDVDTIPASEVGKDEVWYFTVQVNDGIEDSQVYKSNSVAIGNVPPEVLNLTVPPQGFQDVTIKFDLVDADSDECNIVVEYQRIFTDEWIPATIAEALTGLAPGNITLTWQSSSDENIDEPVKFRIRVTPSDPIVTGKPVESIVFTLDNNIPPVASNLEILPPNPTTADSLTASYDYIDPDGGIESNSEIIWYRNNQQTIYAGRTLPENATARGESWHFTVMPKDGAKFGELKTSQPVTVINTPPLVLNLSIIPAQPESDDTLTARYDYRDIDEDKEAGTEIEWYNNGVLQSKVTVLTEADKSLNEPMSKGDQWHVVVKPKDGNDFGEPVTSAPVAVENAVPVVKDITVTGDSGEVTITYTLIDTDEDPCDLNVQYQGGSVASTTWVAATIAEPIIKVIPGEDLQITWISNVDELGRKASNYKIKITPHDGIAPGISATSPAFALNNNTPPSALSMSIIPEFPTAADDLQVQYLFADADGDKEVKPAEIRWFKDGVVVVLYDNLTILPASATSKGERWHYTIKVNDGKEFGKSQISPDVTIGNSPPRATEVSVFPGQPSVTDQLEVRYTYIDPDGDREDGTEIRWYRNDVYMPVYDNSPIIPGVATKQGDEWYFTVTPRDGMVSGIPWTSSRVYVGNTPPSVSSLNITPSTPLTTDDLVASYIFTDPENDPDSGSRIIWFRGAVNQTTYTPMDKYNDLLRLPAEATSKRQVWYFTVKPKDGKQFGIEERSNFVVIGNTPPRAEDLTITPPYPVSGNDLVADYNYTDVDADLEVNSEIKWYKDGNLMPNFNGLRTLPAKETRNGEIWYFTVRPRDGSDYGALKESPHVEVGSPVPRANNLYIMYTDDPLARDPLTTDYLTAVYSYTDPNNLPESGSEITWYRDGVVQSEYSDEKILPPEATAKGEQWYFTVRPGNGSRLGEQQASPPVIIANSAPRLVSVAPLPSSPTTDNVVAVDYIFDDPDLDVEFRNEIKWYRNGTLQTNYNNLTELPPAATSRGDIWHFAIRSSDGSDFSQWVTSSEVVISNGLPRVIDAVILPADPLTDNDLIISYTFVDTEGDPDSGTQFKWYRNGTYRGDYDNLKTIPDDETEKDDQWYCVITPNDGRDFGNDKVSETAVIGNTKPQAVDLYPEVEQVFRDSSVIIIAEGFDADSVDSGDALDCQIQYSIKANTWIDLSAGFTEIPSPHWEAVFEPAANAQLGGYNFRVKFTDSDGAESSWAVREAMVSVENNLPVISTDTHNLHVPEDTIREFDLKLYGDDVEDGRELTWVLDENSVNFDLFEVILSQGRFLTVKPVDDKNGSDNIILTLMDSDGAEVIDPEVNITVDPVNDPPSIPASVAIEPAIPATSDNLICSASGSTDADGDVIVYRFRWYKDEVLQTIPSPENTVSFSKTKKNEVWRCEVTPTDGVSDGPSRSAEVTINNTLPEVSNIRVDGSINDIEITYDLKDLDDDNCSVKLEYKVKNNSWKTATVSGEVSDISPDNNLKITWESDTDEPNTVTTNCWIRLTPDDDTLPVTPVQFGPFFLDNKPPVFNLTAISNPIHPYYIEVTVVSDEELESIPEAFALIGGVLPEEIIVDIDDLVTGDNPPVDIDIGLINSEPMEIELEKSGDNIWTGVFALEHGFEDIVLISIEGVDIVGNKGQVQLVKEFHVPGQVPKPGEFKLLQNFPNPVVDETHIPYHLAESSYVVIEIYNLIGQLVREIDEGYKVAGYYDTRDSAAYWDAKDEYGNSVGSGLYFYCLKIGDFQKVRKMAVSR
ncbi:hypothetical protein GF312_08945 [Candidatus Poribacteria bacterium]|nr:hypothetical protein [Candidatus Poribacteria bacterium]